MIVDSLLMVDRRFFESTIDNRHSPTRSEIKDR